MSTTTNTLLDRIRRRDTIEAAGAPADEIVLRLSRAGDQRALERLAELESRRLPRGTFVVAFVDGELVAAVPLDERAPALADPFRPTASLVTLATQRAREVHAAERAGHAARRGLLARA